MWLYKSRDLRSILYMPCHREIVYTFCIQKLCRMYTTDVYKMYTKCIQNVSHILANFCIHFVAKLWQLNFLCKICANVCRNAGYNLYTFFRHHFSSTKSIYHKNCVYNLFKKFIRNVYINSCMQNGSHISTYFAPFVVNFLVNYSHKWDLETCWQSTWR